MLDDLPVDPAVEMLGDELELADTMIIKNRP